MRRICDGTVLTDWDVDPDASVCPLDSAARAKWGWQQDSEGRWYRDLARGQKIGEPSKSNQESQSLDDRYQVRFGNLDEIFHLSIITDPRFAELQQTALKSGVPLSRAKIEAVFGEIAWEE